MSFFMFTTKKSFWKRYFFVCVFLAVFILFLTRILHLEEIDPIDRSLGLYFLFMTLVAPFFLVPFFALLAILEKIKQWILSSVQGGSPSPKRGLIKTAAF